MVRCGAQGPGSAGRVLPAHTQMVSRDVSERTMEGPSARSPRRVPTRQARVLLREVAGRVQDVAAGHGDDKQRHRGMDGRCRYRALVRSG